VIECYGDLERESAYKKKIINEHCLQIAYLNQIYFVKKWSTDGATVKGNCDIQLQTQQKHYFHS